MRKIETIVTVVDGKITIPVPPDLSPGEHNILVLIDEALATNSGKALRSGLKNRKVAAFAQDRRPPERLSGIYETASNNFPVIHAESWPADLSLRREDMYGEWGR